MPLLRSLLFNIVFYVNLVVFLVVGSPLFLAPRAWAMWALKLWARVSLWWLEVIVGIRMEVRGRRAYSHRGGAGRRQASIPVRDVCRAAAARRPGDGAEARAHVDSAVRLVRGEVQDDRGRPRCGRQSTQEYDRPRQGSRAYRAADPDLSGGDTPPAGCCCRSTGREPPLSISTRAYPACPWRSIPVSTGRGAHYSSGPARSSSSSSRPSPRA